MNAQQAFVDLRRMVRWASIAGTAIVLLVAILGNSSGPRTTMIFFGLGSPFLLALLSLVIPIRPTAQRLIWLVSGLGATVPAFFFLWNGTGFFLILIAGLYIWASVKSRSYTGAGPN
jgi:hypothetical protein